jgi:hypothetical protein
MEGIAVNSTSDRRAAHLASADRATREDTRHA